MIEVHHFKIWNAELKHWEMPSSKRSVEAIAELKGEIIPDTMEMVFKAMLDSEGRYFSKKSAAKNTAIIVFKSEERKFDPYLGEGGTPAQGTAKIARLIGPSNSTTMGGGVVVYEKIKVDWDLPFDEMITVIEGWMLIHSGGSVYDLKAGDIAWFPAHTPLTYEVLERAVVSYAIFPMAQT